MARDSFRATRSVRERRIMARAYPNNTQAITNLQRYLRQLSYFDDDIPPIAITGEWNNETEDALIAFQRKNRLPPTGTADEQTWNLLFSQYSNSLEDNSPPAGVPFFPREPRNESLGIGDESFVVAVIQYMLGELALLYDLIDSVEITGRFDSKTEAAIAEFQKRNLFPQTGRVDKRTWDRLVKAYELALASQ